LPGLKSSDTSDFSPAEIDFPLWQAHCPHYLRSLRHKEGGEMNNIHRVGLSIISASLIAIGTWALPISALKSPVPAQSSVQLQSASGQIATVSRDSFTLTTTNGASQGEAFAQVDSTSKTMMFVIDDNTTIDGKLTVGANADVVYRDDNGNHMAVSVTVSK
jgi:Cu/Ag efflux protein CusF